MIRSLLLASLVAGQFALSLTFSSPAQSRSPADICPFQDRVVPIKKTRTIRGRHGIAFKIPESYRTITGGGSSKQVVGVYDPSHYDWMECMKRNRIPHDSVDPSVAIRINRVNGRSLNKIAIENAGGDRFIGNPRKTQFGNRTGIVYTYEYKGNNHIGFMFLSPDGQHAIQVSYDPASDLNAETADRVINSFSFPR